MKTSKAEKTTINASVCDLVIRLGVGCNAKCLFCNIPFENKDHPELSFAEIKRSLDQFHADHKDCNAAISFSGGEPTLYDSLPSAIAYAKRIGFKNILVQTNGFRFSDIEYARSLQAAGLDKAFVSLHSHIPEKHDLLMGVPGAFELCVQGIRNMQKAGIGVVINIVLNTLNLRDLNGFIRYVNGELSKDGGILFLSLSVVQPHGRVLKHIKLLPRYRALSPYVSDALDLAHGYKMPVFNPYCGLPLCIGGWQRYIEYNCELFKSPCQRKKIDKEKIKGPQCFGCKYGNACGGIWTQYAKLYGFDELKPIT
jgi:MoaA/NifB/PqqE/SkfB family radical SAM enzyme